MHTHTFYRVSTVSSAEAISGLLARFPGAEIENFEHKVATTDDAVKGRVPAGARIFKATLKISEDFDGDNDAPPSDNETEAEPKAESKPPEKSESKPPKSEPKSESSDEPAGDPLDSADDGDDLGVPKMKPDEEIVHLLKQLVDAVTGGASLGGPDAGLGGPPDDLLQVGAPGKGEALPPPAHHGPPPPHGAPAGPPPGGHAGPPLPPPVDKGMGAGPGLAFSKQFSVKRAGVKELGTRFLIADAQKDFPNHKVAHVLRNGTAVVDGYKINLPENDLALITLVAR